MIIIFSAPFHLFGGCTTAEFTYQRVLNKEGTPGEAKRAFDAMMTMKKIDIAAIEAARRG